MQGGQPFINSSGSHDDELTLMIQHIRTVPGAESRAEVTLGSDEGCAASYDHHVP